MSSCGGERLHQVRKCLLTGMRDNVAVLGTDGVYRTIGGKKEVFIHPSSCLFHAKPEAILYTDLVETSKRYMRNVSLIDLQWLNESDNQKQATATETPGEPDEQDEEAAEEPMDEAVDQGMDA